MVAGQVLHLSSQPGGVSPLTAVGTASELAQALSAADAGGQPSTLAIQLDLDLDAPVDEVEQVPADRSVVLTLDPELRHLRLAIVVGPGVLRSGAVAGVLSLATTSGIPVLNTWGAKGVLRWDSPFHAGTAGLQADDWLLGGVAEADVVIASGIDPWEVDLESINPVVQHVPPAQLASLLLRWPTRQVAPRPALYDTLAAVARPLYELESSPLSAARAALHCSGAAPDGAVVVGDVDLAGFWLARTFPTGVPGSVAVPARRIEGFAAAGTLMARLDGVGAVGVTTSTDGPMTTAVLDLARSLGAGCVVQEWTEDGWIGSTAAHVEHTTAAFHAPEVRVDSVSVDLDPASFVEVAGAVDLRFLA